MGVILDPIPYSISFPVMLYLFLWVSVCVVESTPQQKNTLRSISKFNEFEKISLKHKFEPLLTLLKQCKCSLAVLGS